MVYMVVREKVHHVRQASDKNVAGSMVQLVVTEEILKRKREDAVHFILIDNGGELSRNKPNDRSNEDASL